MSTAPAIPVIVTVDVEDYYMSPESIPVSAWEQYPDRLAVGMESLLDVLTRHQARATFFWLGWLAARHSGLVRRCLEAGHEIGTHGWDHRPVWMLGAEGFRDSLRKSQHVLQDITGLPVTLHRAPEFSLHRRIPWMWDALCEAGFTADSSLIPVRTYLFGDPAAQQAPYLLATPSGRALVEWPVATVSVLGRRLPVASGGFLRALPTAWLRPAVRRWEQWCTTQRLPQPLRPALINVHPWELDPDHPRPKLPWRERWIHNIGLGSVSRKLDTLLHGRSTLPLGEAVAASGLR